MQQFEETVTTIHSNGLSIEDHTQDGVRVLTVRGEIDDDVCPQLSAALHVEPGAQRPRIVVDLSGVTFMDSSGINTFVIAYHAVHTAGGWLRIAAPSPAVDRVLNLVGLDTLIGCHPNLERALTA
ncbi:STAS domain-containing protein [Streptomyces sp. NPDC017991]|uniref:STAS domain-containing protein n=1 Tax=Streptomyces sp. NPDC017991 TaxID=3365026 RepID=UPI0037887C49